MNRKLKKAVTLRTTDDLVNAARALWPDCFENGDFYLPSGIEKSLAKELRPDNGMLLDRWMTAHDMDVCSTGRRKLLQYASTYTSWQQYFKARWNDGDGIQHWMRNHSRKLAGINSENFDFFKLTNKNFLDYLNSGVGKPLAWGVGKTAVKWASWPFPAKKRPAKKVAKRKARR